MDSDFSTLTDIGKVFGVSSRVCGRWLADLKLRIVGQNPTNKAHELGLVKSAPIACGVGERPFFLWHTQRIVSLLKNAGHQEVQLLEQCPSTVNRNLLVGPFSYRASGSNWELLNGDGRVFSWVVGGEPVPKYLVQLLNLVYKRGKLPPLEE